MFYVKLLQGTLGKYLHILEVVWETFERRYKTIPILQNDENTIHRQRWKLLCKIMYN